jgi:hypothetical protein
MDFSGVLLAPTLSKHQSPMTFVIKKKIIKKRITLDRENPFISPLGEERPA